MNQFSVESKPMTTMAATAFVDSNNANVVVCTENHENDVGPTDHLALQSITRHEKALKKWSPGQNSDPYTTSGNDCTGKYL
ncbi:unnamed protein product [Rotaria magnacalcarata]